MSVVGYARVSSEDQDLTIQLEQLTEAGCEKLFSEKKSGVQLEKRSELEKCLAWVREGDVLVVTRLDRLARSVTDFSRLMTDLQERGVEFRCLLQPFDTTSPQGKLMMNILAAFAEFETSVRKERQREGIEKARANGVYEKTKYRNSQRWATASRLLNQGQTYETVAERFGWSARTVRRRLPGHNLRSYPAIRAPAQTPQQTHPPTEGEPSAGETSGEIGGDKPRGPFWGRFKKP
jgi:DNA invertase Pin-like site-specific DNA recombinase